VDEKEILSNNQLTEIVNAMNSKLDRIELNQMHIKEMIEYRLANLEKQGDDQETRIRTATEGVTQFKVKSGLTSAGSGLLSIIALLKSFIGG
jgi:hypothetical protein